MLSAGFYSVKRRLPPSWPDSERNKESLGEIIHGVQLERNHMAQDNTRPGWNTYDLDAFEKFEIALATDARRPQNVLDDKNRQRIVPGHNNRALDARLNKDHVGAPLASQHKSFELEHTHNLPVLHGSDSGHGTAR